MAGKMGPELAHGARTDRWVASPHTPQPGPCALRAPACTHRSATQMTLVLPLPVALFPVCLRTCHRHG